MIWSIDGSAYNRNCVKNALTCSRKPKGAKHRYSYNSCCPKPCGDSIFDVSRDGETRELLLIRRVYNGT